MGMKSECLVFSSGLSFIEFVPQNCQCRVRVELQPAFADREEWLFVPMRTCCATDSLEVFADNGESCWIGSVQGVESFVQDTECLEVLSTRCQ